MTQSAGFSPLLSRADVWTAALDPIRGHEQGGDRPCLVVSTDFFNRGPSRLVVLVPITSRDRGVPLHVPVNPPEGGLRNRSFIMCDQVRTVSRERLSLRLGSLSDSAMEEVERRLRRLLRL